MHYISEANMHVEKSTMFLNLITSVWKALHHRVPLIKNEQINVLTYTFLTLIYQFIRENLTQKT